MTKLKTLSEKSDMIVSNIKYCRGGSEPISLVNTSRKLNDAIETINELIDTVNRSTIVINKQNQLIKKLEKVIENLENNYDERIGKLEADYTIRNIKF